jgi:hypothetical protein
MLDNMNKSTVILHESIIRAIKGIISAWERWLNENKQ